MLRYNKDMIKYCSI